MIGVLLGLLLIAGGVVGVVFLVLRRKNKPSYSPTRYRILSHALYVYRYSKAEGRTLFHLRNADYFWMLPLAIHCHTCFHLHPFHFRCCLSLVAKQHLRNLITTTPIHASHIFLHDKSKLYLKMLTEPTAT